MQSVQEMPKKCDRYDRGYTRSTQCIRTSANADHGAYWTDGLAPLPVTHSDTASEADVVIIDLVTLVCTAIVTASQGKTTQVLEAQTAAGDAARSGQISTSINALK